MTGNHPGRSGNPAKRANPGLDQIAAQLRNDRIGRNPILVELEPLEAQLLPLFAQHAGGQVEPVQAGVTMLVLAQLFTDLISKLPPEEQYRAPAMIVNVMRMAGQRLYTEGWADTPADAAEPAAEPEPELRCPFVLPHGAPCQFKPKPSMGGTLTTVMQGHVALHHPGEVWPPTEDVVDEDQADADATAPNPEAWIDGWSREELVIMDADGTVVEVMAKGVREGQEQRATTAGAPAELVCEGCLRPVVLATVSDEQLLAFRFEAHGDGAVLCVECIAALPTPTRDAIEQIIRNETSAREAAFLRDHVDLARRAEAGQLPAVRPALTLPALGECPTCHRAVPLESVTAVASHMIEGTAFQCTGTGLEPVEALSVDPGQKLGTPYRCQHPKHARVRVPGGDHCSACGERLIEVNVAELGAAADRGSMTLSPFNRPQGHVRIEPGFDAHGNITEVSVVADDGQRAQVIPPAGTLYGADGQPICPGDDQADSDGA